MISFHLVEPREAAEMVDQLGQLAALDPNPDNWRFDTAAALLQGKLAMIALCEQSRDVAALIASYNRESRTLHIRGLQSLVAEMVPGVIDAADRAAIQLARDLDAKMISFETQRSGMVKLMTERGYQIDEVKLMKDV